MTWKEDHMIRKTMVLGALLAGLTAAPAFAQQYSGDVVGGGISRMVGGGENTEVVYEQVTHAQPPRLAHATGSPSGWTVKYLEPEPARTGHGMVAHMEGGGENAQVVFEAPASAPQTNFASTPVGAPRS